jgi:nuclear transport factor 2 (NTF2) superfamily protein
MAALALLARRQRSLLARLAAPLAAAPPGGAPAAAAALATGAAPPAAGAAAVRPPLPPFTEETAQQKVQMAEDAWNTRWAGMGCLQAGEGGRREHRPVRGQRGQQQKRWRVPRRCPRAPPPLALPRPLLTPSARGLVRRSDPERVALAYTEDSEWRNRAEFLKGRAAIRDVRVLLGAGLGGAAAGRRRPGQTHSNPKLTPHSLWLTPPLPQFLQRKWAKEQGYRLRKYLFTFGGNRIAVCFEYEYHDARSAPPGQRRACWGFALLVCGPVPIARRCPQNAQQRQLLLAAGPADDHQ